MRLWQHLLKQQTAAAYRYWRIHITSVELGSGYVCVLGEVELRAAIGGGDQTTTATPVTASSSDPGKPPVYLVDNNTDTAWASAGGVSVGTPEWVLFDLGGAASIVQIGMHAWSSGYNLAPKDFIIQGSNDGTNFTNVKSFTGVTGWGAAWKTFDL